MQEDLLRRHRLTVEEYYRMAEAGLLASDARVELIEGEIIDMAPIGVVHAEILSRLTRLLCIAAGDRAVVRPQLPVRLGEHSEPQPDLALLRWRPDGYVKGHPRPSDTLLVIEVSESSLRYDEDIKVPLYARHGIPEAWIVEVAKPCLHVFHTPEGARYVHATSIAQPRMMTVRALADVTLDLTGLFDGL